MLQSDSARKYKEVVNVITFYKIKKGCYLGNICGSVPRCLQIFTTSDCAHVII